MQQTELTTFLVLVNLILLVFIVGIIIFILQYRKVQLKHIKERNALLKSRLDIQQETMQHIGREIHDSVGQKLTLVALYAQQLEFENKYPGINKRLVDIGAIVNDSLSELRNLSRTLTDEQYDTRSLTELVQQECARINDSGVCKVNFEGSSNNATLSATVKNVMLRIVQEFMQNSLKHADCSSISIQLIEDENQLVIKATDDGKGFDEQLVASAGLGLSNMRRRANLIGASFDLSSKIGAGTGMILSFSYQPNP